MKEGGERPQFRSGERSGTPNGCRGSPLAKATTNNRMEALVLIGNKVIEPLAKLDKTIAVVGGTPDVK